MWIIAHDTPVAAGEEDHTQNALERLRERWLELHNRATGGIMGMCPAQENTRAISTVEKSRAERS